MIAAIVPFLIGLGGCSIALGVGQYSERHTPELIDVDSTRQYVESKLGKPVSIENHDDGTKTAIYQKKVYAEYPRIRFDNEPTGEFLFRMNLDLATLFLLEFVMTPLELGLKIMRVVNGPKYNISLIYDAEDRVRQSWLP